MAIEVSIPTPLRTLTDNQDTVEIEAANIDALIESLESKHPGMKERLLDEQGTIRRFVNIYVNGEDVRFLEDLKTPLKESDEVSIVPAIAGG
ncbi:MAG: ubiquitin-like small modifier protein 1 [Verrucomicrobiota bacterium]